MEEEKEKDSSNSAAEKRAARTHDFFNIIMVILVACFAVILGLHYINRTTIESQQESEADITERFFSAQELPSVMEQASHSISGNTLENKHVSSKTTGSTKTTLVRLTSLTKGTAGDEVADWTGNTEDEERDSLTDSNLPVTVEKQESLDYTSIERDKKNVSSGSKTILSHLTEKTKETKEESFTDKSLLDGSTSIEIDKKNVSSASGTISSNSTEETKEMKEESFIDKSSLQDGSTSTLIKLDTSINVTTPEEDFIEKQTKEDSDNDFKILPRRDGVKVGHVQKLELEPGKFYNLKTRSIRPPIFEIPDFLTEYECQQLIYLATQLGLDTSLHQQLDTNYKPTNHETFNEWDHNDDHVVSPQEVIHNMQDTTYLFYSQADIEKMFTELDIDQNRNGVMDLDEFLRVTNDRIMDYLQKLLTIHPRILHRNSRQTWLHYNNVNSLNQRVSALTKIPVNVIERSEKLQVVNYGPEGHYYCHVDSENIDKDLPCCRYYNIHKCRACRYITVLYFLNDVEEGGETAFPVADNATFSIEEWAESRKYKCDLSKYCHEANVYVKPRKGTALMWYNHLRDDQTGWMGELDLKSYHGGCDVIKGHKWIANSWINIIGDSLDTLETYHPKSEPIP